MAYREANARAEPSWFNGAGAFVRRPTRAPADRWPRARANGGANRTGRPFTGDYAGDLFYGTLKKLGLAAGEYRADPDDGFTLLDAMITNAVRCAPPENKPTPAEIAQMPPVPDRAHRRIAASSRDCSRLARSRMKACLRAHGLKPTHAKFAHGAEAPCPGSAG